MEIVTVRFEEQVLKNMDEVIAKNNFNSRTEFIREAVRDKLTEAQKDELIKQFLSLRGKASIKTMPEDDKRIREEVSKELMSKLEKKYHL
jgi:metal-responsive CopG/Arc/MetJ family transcriptional regulator